MDVVSRSDPHPCDDHWDVGLEWGDDVSAPPRRFPPAIGGEPVPRQLVEVTQPTIGEHAGQLEIVPTGEFGASGKGGVGVSIAREHEDLAGWLVSDGLQKQSSEVVLPRIEGGAAGGEIGDGHCRSEEPAARRGTHQVEQVAPVPVETAHGVDEVRRGDLVDHFEQ